MARIDITQDKVIEAVVFHLRRDFELSDRQCFMTIDPQNPVVPIGGDYWLTVSPGDGQYDDELMAAMIVEQCVEHSIVSVFAYTRIQLDSTDHEALLLTEATRGLLTLKKRILRSMSGIDLKYDGDEFVRELLTATYAHAPSRGVIEQNDGPGLTIGMIGLDFRTVFDWDLSSDH